MTSEDVQKLIREGTWPPGFGEPQLVETHISWVVLGENFVFKIKKPIQYPFLDFSTLDKRKYFCEREVQLNQRITHSMYIDVVPVRIIANRFSLVSTTGQIVDYAVQMNRMDNSLQMDNLLKRNQVTTDHIKSLADHVAYFHKKATVIQEKNPFDIREKFNALREQKHFISEKLGQWSEELIDRSIDFSNEFFNRHQSLLISRLKEGFIRDGHGDLHSRNIFLLPEPVIFDCIEFSDDYRQIDVLNEVAFLCMDLDAFNRQDFSREFIDTYNNHFYALRTPDEHLLFIYFKSYRANVRAKVNALRAMTASSDSQQAQSLKECERYLRLMQSYIE